MPSVKGLKVLRPGLHVWTLKKNRFEPSHALALALSPRELRNVWNLDFETNLKIGKRINIEENTDYREGISFKENTDCREGMNAEESTVRGYLNGQTFSAEGEKGWYLICADGFGLGWGKLAGSIMKNHYPRGLRRNFC